MLNHSLSLFLIYFLFLKSSKRNEIIFNSCFYANSITWTESNTWIVSAMRRWSISDRESEIIARWPTPSRHFNSIYSRKFELSRRVPSSSIIRNTRGRDNCAPAPIIPPIFLFSFLAAEMEFFLKKSRRNRVSSNLERSRGRQDLVEISWKLFQAVHGWTDSSSSGGWCGGVNQRCTFPRIFLPLFPRDASPKSSNHEL